MLIWVSQGMMSVLVSPITTWSFTEIYSIGLAAGGLILVAGGYMIDKIGSKNTIIYAIILIIASFIVYIFEMGAVLISGIAILISTLFVIIADIAPSDSRTRYSGVFIGLMILGFLIGQIIGVFGVGSTYIFAYYIAGAVMSGISLVTIVIFGKDTRKSQTPETPRPCSARRHRSPPS